MIVKKVPTSKHAAPKSKALNVRALADYIAGPRAGGDGEKVEHRGAVNLLNIDHEGQVQEMIDLAVIAKRSPQPVQHWIMSWREGEQPTAAQADAAAATFLDEMGLARHQAIYALHRDTHNWHLHLAVNRVDPETERVVTVNNRFDHEVAHRAIARIEQRQGWQREDRALFLVRPDGELERSQPRGQRGPQPSVGARDFEERAGARSDERIALEDAAPIIRKAQSWPELHKALAQNGMRFERKGSGAILWIGDEPVKASCAGRDCSMSGLQKRLGEFTPDTQQRSPDHRHHRAPQPLDPVQALAAVHKGASPARYRTRCRW
jgi:Relaxase/Mobilisation nuclease domain